MKLVEKICWGVIIFCALAITFVVSIAIPAENVARDSACKEIGFYKSLDADKCVNETRFIHVIFDCEGYLEPHCTAWREVLE